MGRPTAHSIYSDVKLDIEGALSRALSPGERRELRNIVVDALARATATGQTAPFSITLKPIRVDATPDVAADAAYSFTRVFNYAVTLG